MHLAAQGKSASAVNLNSQYTGYVMHASPCYSVIGLTSHEMLVMDLFFDCSVLYVMRSFELTKNDLSIIGNLYQICLGSCFCRSCSGFLFSRHEELEQIVCAIFPLGGSCWGGFTLP